MKKYFSYAVGEIVLVVLGILIALQINSCNEDRKSIRLEKQYLTNLKNEIGESLTRLDQSLKFNELTLEHAEKILKNIDENSAYSSSLDTSFYIYQYFALPDLNFTTYETIKNIGLNSIGPDSLRLSISKLYEEEFSFLENTISENERQYYQEIITKFHVQHFKETSTAGISVPNDYEALKHNQIYSNILHKLTGIRMYSISSLKNVRGQTLKVLNRIDDRLDDM